MIIQVDAFTGDHRGVGVLAGMGISGQIGPRERPRQRRVKDVNMEELALSVPPLLAKTMADGTG
jgi:hypothetical protein